MRHQLFTINQLIDVIKRGGSIKTGINIYNNQNDLVLRGGDHIRNINLLLVMKNKGIVTLPICLADGGGVWSESGEKIQPPDLPPARQDNEIDKSTKVEEAIKNIIETKKEADVKFEKAKECITKVLSDIKETGGEFDYNQVQETVSELLDFMNQDESGFSLMTREILHYDDYLYNHSINVCTIATPVIKRFMKEFGDETGCNYPEKLKDISIGYFLHDIGKILLSGEIVNKKGRLTDEEFEVMKKHSIQLGLQVFEKNKITNRFILDSAEFHHAAMYTDEKRCYPATRSPEQIPPYVKVCKMADIYDAMTSRRCYKEAFNPINVINDLYNRYSGKNRVLQLVLHDFITVVGIYPPGSIISLTNGQMAYVMNAKGPVVIPFTDRHTEPLHRMAEPVDMSDPAQTDRKLEINRKSPIVLPKNVYNKLPSDLRDMIFK